jgi:acyl carrier protein
MQSTDPPSQCGVVHAGAVELRNTIGRALALELPGTLVFDCPTAGDIVRYILDNFQLPAAGSITAGTRSALAVSSAGGSAPGMAAADAHPVMSRQAVEAAVAAAVQTLLGEGVAADAPLLAAGLDSLAAVELRNDISRYSSHTAAVRSTTIGPSFRVFHVPQGLL